MVDTDITISNGALGLLGESSIVDFTSSDKALKIGAVYPKFATSLLSGYPWRFARKKSVSLTAATAPTFGREFAFTLPSDLLTIINAYTSLTVNPVARTKYEVFGTEIHTDFTPCLLDYIENVDEDLWPDWYQLFVQHAFAGIMAVSLTDDPELAKHYTQLAFGPPSENGEGGLYRKAKGIDARQQPQKRFKGQTLLAARFSGNRGSSGAF